MLGRQVGSRRAVNTLAATFPAAGWEVYWYRYDYSNTEPYSRNGGPGHSRPNRTSRLGHRSSPMNAAALLHSGSLVLLVLVTLAALSIIVRTLRNGVPPMPSSRRVTAKMMALLRTVPLPEHATVMELGSGWGGVSRALSRALAGATVVAYENSPVPYWFSVAAARLLRVGNLRLLRTDFNRVSLREADLLVCYLSPQAMARLQRKFESELKPSAVVVCSTFALPSWKPLHVEVAKDIYRSRIYVYHAAACRAAELGKHVDIVERAPDNDAGGIE